MEYLNTLMAWIDTSALHRQIQDVDVAGLFSNPWFLVPFLIFLLYSLWKKNFRALFFAALAFGIWYLCGTEFMAGLIEDGEINQGKILPVVGAGVGVIIVIVVLLFGRSD